MKKLFNKLFMVGALAGLLIASGCSDDDEVVTDPTDEFDVTLEFSDATASVNDPLIEDYASGDGQLTVKARLIITSNDRTIRRVYVTQNIAGTGDQPFNLRENGLSNKATKPDGSIDAEASGDATVDYALNLPIPSGIGTNGSVVYKFWATNGKGDYRDPENSLAAGVGQIEITVGTGTNPNAPVKSYTTTILAAPLADGSSETFVSLLDGELYRVDQGEEYSAFWDFGYYYGATLEASLAAAGNYPSSIIDVVTVANTTDAELNSCFFQMSSMTSAMFDAVDESRDLNSITQSSNERINMLEVGDIVEFVDNYGKKGLIRVVDLTPGFGSDGQITIDIKVQP
ncbi:hypothetical protein [Fulvivirga lutea]|uniref:Uncharacterized protein n=1 Tax=Fulvivirga lutea TaxID=2810512 RepID=A0A974WEB0_9BACT|nr:hypothetical protein [Fulvivirga lutea]QSE96718.1 hypothetical protein JR347_14095 [Fulvivirga lutea]